MSVFASHTNQRETVQHSAERANVRKQSASKAAQAVHTIDVCIITRHAPQANANASARDLFATCRANYEGETRLARMNERRMRDTRAHERRVPCCLTNRIAVRRLAEHEDDKYDSCAKDFTSGSSSVVDNDNDPAPIAITHTHTRNDIRRPCSRS